MVFNKDDQLHEDFSDRFTRGEASSSNRRSVYGRPSFADNLKRF